MAWPDCRIRTVLLLALPLLAAGCAHAPPGEIAPDRYAAVIASPLRTAADRGMDASRHPAELLAFAQVQPGMRVLDVSAGGGYTSQLLAAAVGPEGRVWAQAPQPGANLIRRLAEQPQANLVAAARPFDDPVPDGAAPLDLITLILNYHDISYLPVDRARMNARLYAALKPGGGMVVVDHAARDGTGLADNRRLHRIDEALVRREIEQAGFVLQGEGRFLRNPADARDQPSGNSPIPTDRFALRFSKPR
jgi:predicted methyltransferase